MTNQALYGTVAQLEELRGPQDMWKEPVTWVVLGCRFDSCPFQQNSNLNAL